MISADEEIIIALGRIERVIEKMSESSNDTLQDISISLGTIARSQETIAKALVFITGVLDQRL